MKTAILYYSRHHGNTKKLLDAIAARYPVELIDVTAPTRTDFSDCARVGVASGIYYGAFARQALDFAQKHLPQGMPVFLIETCGAPRRGYFDAMRRILREKGCPELGAFECLGFDTFGPLKLIGGIARNHPTQDEISRAVAFYGALPADGGK